MNLCNPCNLWTVFLGFALRAFEEFRVSGFGLLVSGFWFQSYSVTGKSALILIFSVFRVLFVSELQCFSVLELQENLH